MNILPKVPLPFGHPYLPNKYTYWYYSIIENAKLRPLNDVYVENHHIIPDCFFEINRSNGKRPGWLQGNSNDSSNQVTLTFKEHFICHWLLTKMVPKGPQYFKMENTLSIFRRVAKFQKRIMSSGQYARARKATALCNQGENNPSFGNYWWTDGNEELKSAECPGEGWIRGRSKKIIDVLKKNKGDCRGPRNPSYGVYVWTDGVTRLKTKTPPMGWYRVRDPLRWWHIKSKSIELQSLEKPEGAGWASGRLPTKPHGSKGKKWWYNQQGAKIYSYECPGSDWLLGKGPRANTG